MGKKPIVSVTYENDRISIKKKKNSLPYIKCVLHLSCVVHGPIYGRFMGCTVNGFLCYKSAHGPHRRDVTHILSQLRCISVISFHFYRLTIGFFPIKILIFPMSCNNTDVRRCVYFELGLPVLKLTCIFVIGQSLNQLDQCSTFDNWGIAEAL